jgi:hypothetical protein
MVRVQQNSSLGRCGLTIHKRSAIGQICFRRILPDHTIIHRPDCALPCKEQTAFCL